MKSLSKRFLKKLRKPVYFIPAIIILIILFFVGKAIWGGNKNVGLQTRVVERTTVSQEVTVTGNVKSSDVVDLAFETSGKISQIKVKAGDHVQKGAVLATLSNVNESAALSSAQARLSQLMTGARSEDLAVSAAGVQNAETDLSNAKSALLVSINDGFVKADDAVRNHADLFFTDPDSSSPSFGITFRTSSGATYDLKAEDITESILLSRERKEVEKIFGSWSTVSETDVSLVNAENSLQNLRTIQTFLNDTSTAVNSYDSKDISAVDVYTNFKTSIATARTSVSAAISNLQMAIQTYKSKQSSLELSKSQYSLKGASATTQDLQIQQAAVDQARANLNKTIIISPLNGIVTNVKGEEGEIVSASSVQVSVISDSNLEVEVNIPEADIAKVQNGALANITFDAYSKDFVAEASVLSVDPSAVIIDGVPTYRTVLAFNQTDDRIKSGMTANITIKGEKKDNVLVVPQRAIFSDSNRKYVLVLVNDKTEQRDIVTGLRGSDGNIEIISGLSEGDNVVTSSVAQ
jgi:HlyD family secretion protein